jgi:hypothetical protein
MWTDIRQEIERARKHLELTPEQFRPLGLTEWPAVEKQMYLEFTNQVGELAKWTWPWEQATPYKPLTAVSPETDWPHELLPQLVAADESCFVCFDGETKAWWYQGSIQAIVAISAEIRLCEIGVLSKHYEWLLYINHHDVLYAIGEPMSIRLLQLSLKIGQQDKVHQRPAIARPAK